MSMKSIKGAISEHKIVIKLLKEGYHVALAVDPQCPFDLIAVDEEGKCRKYDVKTISHRRNKPTWNKKYSKINRVLTPKQKKLGIEIIEVA